MSPKTSASHNLRVEVTEGPRGVFENLTTVDSAIRAHVVDPDVWKVVWGLKVQNKIRNFLWKAIHNSIPVKTNLVQRKVLTVDSCDHWLAEPVNVLHALWNCPLLDPVWNSDPIWSFRSSS